ncbi:MAG: hypothetical protein DRI83_08535 [Bacteroidetes bacterium]|nr:MAG: hypothetical protein DRI83_08535 [Bacteroidota bacterium]
MKPIRLVTFLTVIFFAKALTIQAQSTYLDSIFDRLTTLDLDSIPSRVASFYSNGYKDRAIELSELYDQALQLFEDSLNVEMKINVAVLDESDWEFVSELPYGTPHSVSDSTNSLAFIAAEPSKVPWQAPGDTTQLPNEIQLEMQDLGVGVRYLAEHQVDIIGVHEIGHGIADQMDMWSELRWLNEVIATYFQLAFLKYRRPELYQGWLLIREIKDFQRRENPYKPTYTSLNDFENLYFEVGPENYEWYQIQFEVMATKIFPDFGFSFVRTIKEQELHKESDTKVLINKLEQEFLGFVDWEAKLGKGR